MTEPSVGLHEWVIGCMGTLHAYIGCTDGVLCQCILSELHTSQCSILKHAICGWLRDVIFNDLTLGEGEGFKTAKKTTEIFQNSSKRPVPQKGQLAAFFSHH